MDCKRLALLIDADNLSSSLLPSILSKATALGEPIVQQVFGDFSDGRLAGWKSACVERGLQPVLQLSSGKNSTDIAMTIHAMDLLRDGQVDGICLASSDRDFAPLALRVRRAGLAAYGIGEAKASPALRAAFTAFFEVGAKTAERPAGQTSQGTWVRRLAASIEQALLTKGRGGWIDLPTLKGHIVKHEPDLAIRLGGKGKFLKSLVGTGVIERQGAGPATTIRLKDCLEPPSPETMSPPQLSH